MKTQCPTCGFPLPMTTPSEGLIGRQAARLEDALLDWRINPRGHAKERIQHLSRMFQVGVYPEWVLKHAVGRTLSQRDLERVCVRAGLVRIAAAEARDKAGVRRGPKSGSYWTYPEA